MSAEEALTVDRAARLPQLSLELEGPIESSWTETDIV
jgi:hypothetical protein